jgi:two-component system, response regulator PdtaR
MDTKTTLPKRVLIVEDDSTIAFMLQMCYEFLGCEVIGSVETAEDSLRFVQGHTVDLVSMDIALLGVESGIDAAVELRKRAYMMPIIFVSANNDIEEETKLVANSLFLRKPIDLEDLTKAVQHFVAAA